MIGAAALLVSLLALHVLTPFWWWIVVAPLAYGMLAGKPAGRSFLIGGATAAATWGSGALVAWAGGAGPVAGRVAEMLSLGSPAALVAVTACVAAIPAGLAALSGSLVSSNRRRSK